jgi:hypothetical protein
MLTVLDKNLITWKLEALPQEIDEIILIVGYLQDIVRAYFGSHWNGIPIRYIEQPTLNGTGGVSFGWQNRRRLLTAKTAQWWAGRCSRWETARIGEVTTLKRMRMR